MFAEQTVASALVSRLDPVSRSQAESWKLGTEDLIQGVLDFLPYALFIVDGAMRVLLANAAARKLADRGDAVTSMEGTLQFVEPETAERFVEGLQRLGRRTAEQPQAAAFGFRVDRSGDKGVHRALISRVGAGSTSVRGARIGYCVGIFDAEAQRRIAPQLLRELHGLTAAEAGVAAQLYAGGGISEAAQALRVSSNTVKTHLKHIFQKCAVRSQAELLQLLALGPQIAEVHEDSRMTT